MLSRFLLIALGAALLFVGIAIASADYDDNMADAIKKLQQLDRYYSQLARPRLTRSEGGAGHPVSNDDDDDERDEGDGSDGPNSPFISRAVRLLQLHSLSNYYSQHSRPRFGKRAYSHIAWERENPTDAEGPENWIPYPRRR